MSSNLIELLKDRVSPLVLKGDATHLVEKDQALTQFYPVLLTILRARPALIHDLNNQLNPTLLALLQNNVALKNQLLGQLSHQVPQSHMENLLEQAIAPSLNFIAGEAGANSPQAISNLLDHHAATIQQYLPQWAVSLLGSMGISVPNSTANQNTTGTHKSPNGPNADEEPLHEVQEEMRKNTWLPFIILIVLAAIALFLYKQCAEADELPPTTSAQIQSVDRVDA